MTNARRTRVALFWLLVATLVAAQQCSLFWQSGTAGKTSEQLSAEIGQGLILGFLPTPLFYHVCVSLAAVVIWWIGTIVAWPGDAAITGARALSEASPGNRSMAPPGELAGEEDDS